MTLGVRILVSNENEEVLLVRHGYVPGWHLPGGGVETGETIVDTARKELLEETGVEASGEMALLAFFANRRASKRDHVALVRFERWQVRKPFVANREILEIGFFNRNNLPPDTTVPTQNRIQEAYGDRKFPPHW